MLDIDIPPGLATGIWDLSVEHSSQSTTDSLSAAFMVVDTLSLDLGVQPAALPDVEGGVIRLSSKSQFAAVPQVLLVSSSARGGSMGMRLRGVQFNGPDDVIAPVPPGLFAGDYDVIVINPDGGAGVAAAALAVSSDQAPSVGEVFPSSFSINDATSLTISGSGFQAGIFAQLVCEDGLTQALTVDDVSGTSVDVTYFPGGLSQGVCTMDLQNPDGQVTSFAAIRLNPPAGGIGASEAASAMNIARRAPSLALHRAASDHFTLYAMGGDDGMSANVLGSVEIADVTRFGDLGSWRFSRHSLPAGRSFAWAGQLGEFLYLLGGSDGSTATDTIYRAQVLDPADAPMVARHTMMYFPGAPGFSGGQQVYRVSAMFPGSDPINPDGESLSGRSRIVFVPNATEVALNLEWDAVPGATAYRIYTHPVGVAFDGNIHNLELAATTSSTSWIHTGQITDPVELPLREGDTGTWHLVSGWGLGTPRSHFAGALAPLPGAAGSSVFYAIGGLDEKDATLGSYEYAIVSSADTLAPIYGSFSVGTDTLATAVSELVAMVVTAEGTDDSWIFMGTGLDSSGFDQRNLERGAVSMTGDLGTLVAGGSSPTQDRAGASGLAGFSSLGLAGGLNGLSSTSVQLSNFDDSGSGPEMDNWNAAFGLIEPRIYAGTAHGSVFIFVAGGEDDKAVTLSSVERMLR